jgi:hypothetical protein
LNRSGRIAVALTILAVLSAAVLTGCGGGEEKISEIVLSNIALQDSFALYYPVPVTGAAQVQPYSVSPNLSNVVGAGAAGLSPELVRMLGSQGFAAVAGGAGSINDIYQDIGGAKFVSLDALTHTFHFLIGYSLLEIENNVLLADLDGLIGSLYESVEAMYRGSEGVVREAALADLGYLGVAARLLGLEVDVPAEVAGTVEEELALIASASAVTISPLFGYEEDYTSFKPTGRYAGDEDSAGYFQAMTWLGKMGFCPSPGSTPTDIVAGRDMTRQALLLVGALHMAEVDGTPALTVWDRIYQPVAFLGGTSGQLDVYIYSRLAGEVFGTRFPLGDLADDTKLDGFIARAEQEQDALSGAGEDTGCFLLFPLPYRPDDYVFERLVSPEVAERFLPRGLDFPAALGSDRALEILDTVYLENEYEGYAENMEELRREFEAIDSTLARESAYWGWLEAVRVLLEPPGEGYPSFMRGQAWRDRDIYAFLGSWAESRHDADFFLERTSAPEAPSGSAGVEKGYVEPRPKALASLAASVDMLRRGLEDRGLISEALRERLAAFFELLVALKTMAEKELRNEALSAEEYAIIANFGDTLEYLQTIPRAEEERGVVSEGFTPLVADVFVDPDYEEVLQAAVGRPLVCYVVAPVEGVPTLTVGAGLSYYEFVKPSGERLNDEAWLEMVNSGQLPETPAWTISFTR